MQSTGKSERKKVFEYYQGESYSKVVEIFRRERIEDLGVRELLLFASALQLSGGDDWEDVEEADELYLTALCLEPDNVPTLVERGYFLLAVMDDASEALECFDRAIRVAQAALAEAIVGKANCLVEVKEGRESGASLIREAVERFGLSRSLQDTWEEWPVSRTDPLI